MIRLLARKRRLGRSLSLSLTFLLVFAFLPPPPAAQRFFGGTAAAQDTQEPQIPVIAPGSAYRQTNLISDVPGLAPVLDPLLVNPWGISLTARAPSGSPTTGRARRSSSAATWAARPSCSTRIRRP